MKKEKIKIVVTAGPTREPIDPVRFISNYSTGVLGYAIAKEARKRGHKVILITGPTCLKQPSGVKVIEIETALQMRRALLKEFKDSGCLVMNAAVCDYRPLKFSTKKLKKDKKVLEMKLVENPDILRSLSNMKGNKVLVGFAVETEDIKKNAFVKLKNKNLDLIIATRAGVRHTLFGHTRITPYIINESGECEKTAGITKQELARKLLDRIEGLWYTKSKNKRR